MVTFVCLKDVEDRARIVLPKSMFEFIKSGASGGNTVLENEEAFKRYQIRPRLLRDVSKRDLSVSILGSTIAFPVAVAPTAFHCLAHPHGEIATARAAASLGTGICLSSFSSKSLEEVASAVPEGIRWIQLYMNTDREFTKRMVHRAEQNGYRALVVTIDAPCTGTRWQNQANNFPMTSTLKFGNFKDLATGSSRNELVKVIASQLNPALTWADITWLKSITKLPVIVKGVLTAETARDAVCCGVAGILVSNHGGRQLDDTPATIDVLAEVTEAVRGSGVEVYMDGGIRSGIDVVKALALGAKAVFVGRSPLYGLACNGEEGVKTVLQILRDEIDNAMALSGCASVSDIDVSLVTRREYCRPIRYISKL